jgi:hypothetical protein
MKTSFQVVSVLVFCVLMHACNIGYKQAQAPMHATAELKAGASVSVESRNGKVQIIGDDSVSEVQVNATIRCSGKTQQEADARLAKASLDVAYDTSGMLTIRPVFPDGPLNNDGASITVRLPTAQGVNVKTSNGPVTVCKLAGQLNIQTSNGRVSVNDHDGPAVINTSNSPVEVQQLSGSLTVDTSNGRVDAINVGGPVTIDTSNSPIRLALRADQSGPLKLDTSNSSVAVSVGQAFTGSVKFDTSNGRVTVKDPAKRIRTQQLGKKDGNIVVGDGGANSVIDTSNGGIEFEIKS